MRAVLRSPYFKSRIKQVLVRVAWWYVPNSKVTDDSAIVAQAPPVNIEWKRDVPKPFVGLVRDTNALPYWTKYKRFLENNSIRFEYYDIHRSDWLEKASRYDVIILRPDSGPSRLAEARRKVYVLEKHMCKTCFPSYSAILLYEDKLLQYELLKLNDVPVVETHIAHDYRDATRIISEMEFPIVAKIQTGSGSRGVNLLRSRREAARYVRAAFSYRGRKTYWPYMRQKDYVYFQPLVENYGYDLRIIVIGNYVAGYYRYPLRGDFRASGMGLYSKESIPPEAISVALQVSRLFEFPMVAVDVLKAKKDDKFKVIEASPFFQISTPEQLHVDGRPGIYAYDAGGNLVFREGRFWPQELALATFFMHWQNSIAKVSQ